MPDAGEVLIAVDTAGVGVWDAEMRDGSLASSRKKFPLVLGTDGSGVIAAIGSGVRRFKLDDRVYSYAFENRKGGFYAEYVAVSAKMTAHIPKTLDLEHAGAIPTTGLTALQGIDDALHLKKGETIIIHGSTGGVGSLAVQFAKLREARVLATASGQDGMDFARRLGADMVIDGRQAISSPPHASSHPTASMPCLAWLVVRLWSDASIRSDPVAASPIQTE